MIFLIALISVSPAAQIEVTFSGLPARLLVDGVDAPFDDAAGMAIVRDLPAGKHSVETRTLGGKTSAWKEFELAADDRIRFEFRKKELWEVGTWKLEGAPPVVVVTEPAPVVIPAVGDPGVVIDIQVPGMKVSVSDTMATDGGIRDVQGRDRRDRGSVEPAPVHPAPEMDASRFAGVLSMLEGLSFSDEKLEMVKTVSGSNRFTCAQVAQILGKFAHSSDQVEAVRIMRPSIVDPENAFVLTADLAHSSDRTEVLGMFQ